MADGHGGSRPGAGRRAGTKNKTPSKAAAAQERLAALVDKRVKSYFDVLDSIALNDELLPLTRLAAIRELLDRGIGRAAPVAPPEPAEVVVTVVYEEDYTDDDADTGVAETS